MKFEKIKAGDVLYDVHSYRMGNTRMQTMGCWTVKVIEIDTVHRRALVSWNGNEPQWKLEHSLKKFKAKKPELEQGASGQMRLKKKAKVDI